MNLTTVLGNLTLRSYSAAYVAPIGLTAAKTFKPNNFFPGMRPQVNVTVTNQGSAPVFNVTVSTVLDGFASASSGASSNTTKTYKEIAPRQTVAFNYFVSVAGGESGNKTLLPVHVDFGFAGLRAAFSIPQGTVAIYPLLVVSIAASPVNPQENNPFSMKISISNPAQTSVSNVTLTMPLPAGLKLLNGTGVRVTKTLLIVQVPNLGPKQNYVLNVTLTASNGVEVDLSKSVLTFNYQGFPLKGKVPQSSVSVSENVVSRYFLPTFIALFITLLTIVIIRRRVLVTSPSSHPQTPQKQP
jgi:hypothetical protein